MPLFTPEEKKIFDQEVELVKKGMLANKRALVSKYGKDAEKVIQGNAVKKALKKIENLRQNQEMENNKLKEAVKAALMNPKKADLNKDGKLSSYEKTRGAAIEKAMQKEDLDLGHEDNEPRMLKADLYKIGKYAMELYQTMDKFEGKGEVDFPAWWQNKINTAGNMMSSAKHYLDFELKEPELGVDIPSISISDEELKEERFEKGTDIGKKGAGFAKIEKAASKKYGSEEAGKRVAGAILKKILKK